jgi:hypothetical protein
VVAYYEFDGNAQDTSVYENDGTISGGVTFIAGMFNQAACFNGINGYVEAPYHSALSLMEWSISAWVYPVVMPTAGAILVGREDNANSKYNYALTLGPDFFRSQYETATSEFDHIVRAYGVTPNLWYHVVGTRNINGDHKIYLNGELKGSGIWNDTPVQNNQILIIARYVDSYPGSDRFFNGCLDDVRIYNRELSDSEIQALFNSTITVKIDVKPNSCPNPLNIDSKGVLSVAVHGTPDFDITTIDTASVRLEGVAPIRSSIEDVVTPVLDPQSVCECNSDGADGFDDLVLKFRSSDISDELGELQHGDVVELILTGNLNDGTSIEGFDCIVCVGKKNKD